VARASFTWTGYTIPAGTVVLYSPFVSHRLADQFPDPGRFRPERFDPAGGATPAPYAYIPFGGGGRACLGAGFAMMEIRTVLAMILQRYRLDLAPGPPIRLAVRLTLQPRDPLMMRAIPRAARDR
jgi:cytochrome P450